METEKRREYNSLVKQGKEEEAIKLIVEIHSLEGGRYNYRDFAKPGRVVELPLPAEEVTKAPAKKSVTVKKEVSVKEDVVEDKTPISTLSSIKGIGKKTVKDISSMYGSVEELTLAIMEDKPMPFRDDIVEILSKELL